jgi:predicted dehydrogenase
MAHTIEGCMKIVRKVEETGRSLGIAHVLRYTPFFSKIHDMVRSGNLGEIVNITWRENLSWYHHAHSFVRGNWGNVKKSSPMILAKCCHDFDLLVEIVRSFPKRINSFGSLSNFKPEKAPKGVPKYCVEGCPIESDCNYYAPRIYVDIVPIIQIVEKSENRLFKFFIKLKKNHKKLLSGLSKLIPSLKSLRYWQDWPVDALYVGQKEDFTDEAKLDILKTSPYGKCVYFCDNNVVDHQTVNIEFSNGVTANLTMHGFSHKEGRTLRIDGTKASLIGEFCDSGEKIVLCDHYSGKEQVIFKEKLSMDTASHGGGDFLLIDAFIDSISNENKKQPLTNARESLESHLMAFAAEESRLNKNVIDMEQFRKNSD